MTNKFTESGLSERNERLRSAVARMKTCVACEDLRSDQRMSNLKRAVERLKNVVQEDFKQTEWPRLQRLHEIFQKGYGLPVPVLSVCGEGTAEVRFTKLLAYFLDSRRHHGLGGLVAAAAFWDLPGLPDKLNFGSCTAKAEVPLGKSARSDGMVVDNHVDIVISVGKLNILVEQKINSSEGLEQTARYSEAIRSSYADSAVCVFLTRDGRLAKDPKWMPYKVGDLFARMAALLEKHALSAVAQHNLRALLWDLMVGPMAQNPEWMDRLAWQVEGVSKNISRRADFCDWLARHGLSTRRERLAFLAAIGG